MTQENDPIALFMATRGSHAIKLIVAITIAALSLTTLIHLLEYGELNSYSSLPAIAVLGAVIVLIQLQYLRLAFELFLWGMLLVALISGFTISGFQTPGMLLLPITTTLAGWLLGAARSRLMLIITLLAVLSLAWLQSTGHIPMHPRDPWYWAVVYVAVCSMGAILSIRMTSSIREQYQLSGELRDELALLNQELEAKVEQRTRELNAALEDLQRAQNDLIQFEKLAALGSTVAGIAHELNTPIGNAVTVLSSMDERVNALRQLVDGGTLKRSELNSALSNLSDMAKLSERSVNRAATLINSFKQVAVDQVSERRRVFDVRDVVEEHLLTLRPGLKHAPWQIDNQVPAGLACDSFPGPLGQVLINLIQNAIIHGFHQREEGRIEINGRIDEGMLNLVVSDDGVGMDTTTTMRIFEPFFTTTLGKGGSGLGLAISHRITSTILAGELRVHSSLGTGSQFTLRIPIRAPGKI